MVARLHNQAPGRSPIWQVTAKAKTACAPRLEYAPTDPSGRQILRHLKSLSPEEKRALADFLWLEADAQHVPELSDSQAQQPAEQAEEALKNPSERFPLGDAEKKLRRDCWFQAVGFAEDLQAPCAASSARQNGLAPTEGLS